MRPPNARNLTPQLLGAIRGMSFFSPLPRFFLDVETGPMEVFWIGAGINGSYVFFHPETTSRFAFTEADMPLAIYVVPVKGGA